MGRGWINHSSGEIPVEPPIVSDGRYDDGVPEIDPSGLDQRNCAVTCKKCGKPAISVICSECGIKGVYKPKEGAV